MVGRDHHVVIVDSSNHVTNQIFFNNHRDKPQTRNDDFSRVDLMFSNKRIHATLIMCGLAGRDVFLKQFFETETDQPDSFAARVFPRIEEG